MIYPDGTTRNYAHDNFARFMEGNGWKDSFVFSSEDVFPSIVAGLHLHVNYTQRNYTGEIYSNGIPRGRDVRSCLDSAGKKLLFDAIDPQPKVDWVPEYTTFTVRNATDARKLGVSVSKNASDFARPINLHIKEDAGSGGNSEHMFAEREQWESLMVDASILDKFVVAMPQCWGTTRAYNAEVAKRGNLRGRVFEPNWGFGHTFKKLRVFDSEIEAQNFCSYVNSYVFLLCSRFGTFSHFPDFLPDLVDYSSNNSLIDWRKPLDVQILASWGITDEDDIETIFVG